VHRVFSNARRSRFPKVFPLVAVLALAVTACGADLGKSNFARTTVPAAAGASTDGPITDAAVATDVLRLIKPCQFLTKEALASLGTAEEDPRSSSIQFEGCDNSVKDPGGKTIRFTLTTGSASIPSKDKTAGTVGGLPLRESKQDSNCSLGAVTTQPKFGILLSVDYTGGDPCRAGQTLLEAVVTKLHNNPDKYQTSQGTLLTADACAVLDSAAVGPVAPGAKGAADSLHSCTWTAGTDPSVVAGFRPGLPPIEGNGYEKTDLGSGITAYKKQASGKTSDCVVEWKHRTWEGDQVELAQLEYRNYSAGATAESDDPCGKAVTLAKAMVTKLPKP